MATVRLASFMFASLSRLTFANTSLNIVVIIINRCYAAFVVSFDIFWEN